MSLRISMPAMLCIALSCSAFGGEASTTDLIRQRGLVGLGNSPRTTVNPK